MAPRKAKRYCIAYGCLNNDRSGDLSLFTLPKDIERCQEWLALLNREDLLTRSNFKPANYNVCSAHFKENSFKICGLKQGSLPIKITKKTPDQPQESTSTSSRRHFEVQVSSDIQVRKPTTANQPSQTELLEQLEKETQTSNSLTAQKLSKRKLSEDLWDSQHKCRRLNEDTLKKRVTSYPDGDDEVALRLHKLIEWQNKLKNKFKGNRYDRDYTFFALNLYYASPHTYRFLQTILKLPNKATFHRFKINIPPKLDNRVMKCLEFKIQSLPDTAKYCTIRLDEMTLKRNLYYNIKTDELIGLHNINGKVSSEIASNAYKVMLQGIHIKWKQPLAYALLASAKHYEELDLWLEEIVTRLFAIGIKVKAITSDQGSIFDEFAKDVKHVTVDKPYFMYGDQKIFYIFDVRHLLKCIRNHLITCDFHYGEKNISWDYIKQLYDDQKNKNLRLIPKLTESHVDPDNLKKMQVQYAVQVFSRTVSAALHTYIDLGIISEEGRPTANFVETMNNLFDILNSSKIKCNNKNETALRRCDHQKVIDDALEMFSKIKAIDKTTKKENTTHLKSFINAQISIQSIKQLYEDLKQEGFKYLLTRRLNQDCLENCVGCIRLQRGPCKSCNESTPIQFQRAFSKLFVTNMLKNSPNVNSEADLYDILLQAEDVMKTFKLSSSESAKTSVVCLDEADYRLDLPEENALTYVSGYLLFKCMSKHRCQSIEETLKSLPDLRDTKLFTKYNKRSEFYGALKMPPEGFIQYIQNLEDVFTRNFEKTLPGNPGAELYELMQAVSPQTPCPCFPLNYLLKLFIRLRIYATLRFNSRRFKDEKEELKAFVKIRHL